MNDGRENENDYENEYDFWHGAGRVGEKD